MCWHAHSFLKNPTSDPVKGLSDGFPKNVILPSNPEKTVSCLVDTPLWNMLSSHPQSLPSLNFVHANCVFNILGSSGDPMFIFFCQELWRNMESNASGNEGHHVTGDAWQKGFPRHQGKKLLSGFCFLFGAVGDVALQGIQDLVDGVFSEICPMESSMTVEIRGKTMPKQFVS